MSNKLKEAVAKAKKNEVSEMHLDRLLGLIPRDKTGNGISEAALVTILNEFEAKVGESKVTEVINDCLEKYFDI